MTLSAEEWAGRRAQFKEFEARGLSRSKISEASGLSQAVVSRLAREMKLVLPRETAGWEPHKAVAKARAAPMADLYQSGMTLQEIGTRYGISRERVRQLITKHHQMNATSGGQHVVAEINKARRDARRDAKYLESHGCTFAEYVKAKELGKQMLEQGAGHYQRPLPAFRSQRNNAKNRGIGWFLNFSQWWEIWQQSGHWEDRGRGQGYVMCRKGDLGPYAVDNVFIATAVQNSSEGQRGKRADPSLPIGVRKTHSGRFVAFRHIGGKNLRLGTHDTPDLAYAAYLAAGSRRLPAKAERLA